MTINKNFHIYIMFFLCTLFCLNGCSLTSSKSNIEYQYSSSENANFQPIEDYSYLKPYMYSMEYEKISVETETVYMDRLWDGFRREGVTVFSGSEIVSRYTQPIYKEILNEYILERNRNGNYSIDSIMSLFYDPRTIKLDKKELTELFSIENPNVYVDFFEIHFDSELTSRVYTIQFNPINPTWPSINIVQTWDNENIYCQEIGTVSPRRFTNIIKLDQQDKSEKLLIWCYNLGVGCQDISTELQYWEFKDSRWTPCELNFNFEPGFIFEEYYVGEEKRSSIAHTIYPDGIAFYDSILASCYYRFDEIETLEESKIFRVSSRSYPKYYVDLSIVD